MSGQVTIFGGIDGPIARILDGRLDDGAPDSGRVQSQDVDSVNTMAAGQVAETSYDDEVSVNMAFRL
jgi:hypothetical protein